MGCYIDSICYYHHCFFINFCLFSSCQGRAKKKMDELERLLEIAKKNYVQFGGRLGEDRRKLKEDRDNKRLV